MMNKSQFSDLSISVNLLFRLSLIEKINEKTYNNSFPNFFVF